MKVAGTPCNSPFTQSIAWSCSSCDFNQPDCEKGNVSWWYIWPINDKHHCLQICSVTLAVSTHFLINEYCAVLEQEMLEAGSLLEGNRREQWLINAVRVVLLSPTLSSLCSLTPRFNVIECECNFTVTNYCKCIISLRKCLFCFFNWKLSSYLISNHI